MENPQYTFATPTFITGVSCCLTRLPHIQFSQKAQDNVSNAPVQERRIAFGCLVHSDTGENSPHFSQQKMGLISRLT